MGYLVVYHCSAHDWTTAKVVACYETDPEFPYAASGKRLIPGATGVEMGISEVEWVAMRYQDEPAVVGTYVEQFEDDEDSDLIGDWKIQD